MAILPITVWGESVLHVPAKPVDEITDEIRELVADMYDTMVAAPGVGLAAPQVGEPLRLFVYEWTEPDGTHHRGEAINPELWQAPLAIGELQEDRETEGCLSVPGEQYPLRRSQRVILRATNLEGERYEIEASGWLARIFQHEYDHLDGVIYVNRLDFMSSRKALKEIAKAGYKGGTWMPGEDDED